MKKLNTTYKTSFFKKIFIKICRIFGYEIIDQSNFFVPTLEKNINENLNIPGKKSINLPLGETKISRKVIALTIIFRSCTSVDMLTQNKKRLFNKDKSEYTFRSLNSILKAIFFCNTKIPNFKFNIIIVDNFITSSNKSNIKNDKKYYGIYPGTYCRCKSYPHLTHTTN